MGRPTKYKPEFAITAKILCELGAVDVQVAEALGVSEQTLNAWKKAYPKFLESLKDGKAVQDNEVEASLLKRAKGFTKDDKYYPPEVVACIFWLKNRRSNQWRDKHELEVNSNVNIKIVEDEE